MSQWTIILMNHGNHWEFYFSQNALIIQVVVSIILLLSIYVIYKSYFSKNSTEDAPSGATAFDSSAIEKTLTRILEKQAELQSKVQSVPREGGSEGIKVDPELESKLVQAEAKMQELKKEVEEKQKQIQDLQSAGGTVGGSNAASSDLTAKLQELETKLAEYEIISDDLADLSRFKTENVNLKKEIEELKKKSPNTVSSAAASAPVAPTPQSTTAQPSPAAQPAPTTSSAAPIEEPAAPPIETPAASAQEPVAVSAAPAPETVTQPSAAAPSQQEAPSSGEAVSIGSDTGEIKDMIDDDLMKEFEAAVAQQKKGVDKVITPEPAKAEAEKTEFKTTEAGELIDQFENFVKKE